MQVINSKQNNKLKHVYKLSSNKAYRHQCNQAVIYGEHLIEEALRYNRLLSVFIVEDAYNKYQEILKDIQEVHLLPDELIKKINVLDGEIEIAGIISVDFSEIDQELYDSDVVILDNIQDPGNLGTIFRTMSSCGVEHAVLHRCVDPYSVKVLRASQAIQLGLNLYILDDLDQLINNYKGEILATSLQTDISLYQKDLTTSPIMWIFGNEGLGVSEKILTKVNNFVKIPHENTVESLNVAQALTVCLFEMYRQRISR